MTLGRRPLIVAAMFTLALFAQACSKDSTPATPTPPTSSCSYTVSQPTTAFGAEGGTGTVAVTTTTGCTWTATSSGAFVTISQGASGSGNGTVQFSVAVNAGADRVATLTIAGTAISISQRAPVSVPVPPPTLSAPSARSPIGGQAVEPGRPTLVVNNATATGNIGAVTYRFEVSDLNSFPPDPLRTFTQDGVVQGAGTSSWTLTRDLGANVLWYWRARATNGTVTSDFSPTETFSTGAPCSYVLTPVAATVAGSAGTMSTFTVTTGNFCTWTAVSNDPFITIVAGASGTGSGAVTFAVSANSATVQRTGTITVAGMGIATTFAVTQDVDCVFNPTPNFVNLSNAAFVGQTFVVTTSRATCGWKVDVDSPWLSITAGVNNTGQGTVTYSVLANTTLAQRIGNIIITGLNGGTGASFVVTQQP